MTESSFRFAPDILRRLGEELNPSLDQGVLELVKNAYDADALNCTVRISNSEHAGGSIEILDDGDGLSLDGINNGWLVLGRSNKSTAQRTALGRTPAGNKGLGRLAALRLGSQARLVSRPRGANTEHEVLISWDRFSGAALVEDVTIPVTVREPTREPGTQVQVLGLHARVGRMDVKRLARSLILLADPFGDNPAGFRPILEAPEFSDLEKLVDNRYFQDADYHLIASLSNGQASASIVDWRGEVLFEVGHEGIAERRNGGKYSAPDSTFDLWAFILTRASFSTRSVTLGEVKEWIDAFGGVHLYLNGLRVSPYGNSGNDWLDMNLRRVQSPEERPSTNTSIGRVAVSDKSALLAQKTDRSGFIENAAFDELRDFCQDSLEWMAKVRLQTAENRRRRERSTTETKSQKSRESLAEQIGRAPEGVRNDLQLALDQYDRARQRETDTLRREVQLYRTLSTAGITAATFAHESAGNPIKVITQSINAVEFRARRSLTPEVYDNTLDKPVESIKRASGALAVLSSATLRLIHSDKRRVGRVNLNEVVRQVLETFEPFFNSRDVDFNLSLSDGQPFLRGTEAAIESVVTNFLNNSLAAFESNVELERLIWIETEVLEGTWRLSVSDSGPGLVDITEQAIWLPGETRRANGTGLGLTIVRDAVSDLGGTVGVNKKGDLGGATFSVELPVLGVA